MHVGDWNLNKQKERVAYLTRERVKRMQKGREESAKVYPPPHTKETISYR